jgi:hypothetical protein
LERDEIVVREVAFVSSNAAVESSKYGINEYLKHSWIEASEPLKSQTNFRRFCFKKIAFGISNLYPSKRFVFANETSQREVYDEEVNGYSDHLGCFCFSSSPVSELFCTGRGGDG